MATLDMPEAREQTKLRSVSALRRILVHVERGDRANDRIRVAADFAERFGSKLTGVFLLPSVVPMAFPSAELSVELLAELERLAQQQADEAMRRYLDDVVRRNLQGEWRCLRGPVIPALRQLSRYLDLSVVGQVNPDLPEEPIVRPEELALASGGPVLVVPYIGAPAQVGRRFVIAWNGGREAARAVHDAMPLLRQAQSVTVVSIDVKGGAIEDSDNAAADLARYLADHEIAADTENLPAEDISPADLLLSRSADLGADMIVMGCYGHSRLRETVLGGMTRHILAHMTVPVLMSH